jgi:hypothetical protein
MAIGVVVVKCALKAGQHALAYLSTTGRGMKGCAAVGPSAAIRRVHDDQRTE